MSRAVLHRGAAARDGDLLSGEDGGLGLWALYYCGNLKLPIVGLIDIARICHDDTGEESSGNE